MVRSLYDDFVRTFGNVLFAVLLLVVWGLMTLIGVIVEQGKDSSRYFEVYSAPVARLVLRLNFDNVYHTPYYVGIIGLILLSLAVCTFKRVIPARLPALRPVKIDAIPLHASIDTSLSTQEAQTRVERFFRSRGWQVRKREFDATEWTFADRHNWARRGVLVAHIGFTIIAAGTTLYWARGFSGDIPVVTGQTVDVPAANAAIRLNDFAYRVEPIATKSGIVYQPIDYVSKVTVTDGRGTTSTRTIRVNHPIDVNGTLFYQASYGFAMRFDVTQNGRRVANLSDRVYLTGDAMALPGTGSAVTFEQFVPSVDSATGRPAPDPRVNNPAVVLGVAERGTPLGSALVPLHTWIDAARGWRITPRQYLIVSGLQYRYDPGVGTVGVGAFVLLAGLVISFYFLPARLYARVDASPSGAVVGVAATTVKGYDIFETEFQDLVRELHGHFSPRPAPRTTFAEASS